MLEVLPSYVSTVFILTTFLTIGILLTAVKSVSLEMFSSRLLIFTLPFWIILTGSLAVSGFYIAPDAFPPRLVLFGIIPALIFLVLYVVAFRTKLVAKLPLRSLTLIHVVRVPVELVLYWLSVGKLVPQLMTFEGCNYDIVTGFLALAVYFLAISKAGMNRWLLIGFNVIGLILLINIVSIAALSLPSPVQQFGFDQPNRAVLLFPYVWLPTIIVPIVLFSHLASLYKLATNKLS